MKNHSVGFQERAIEEALSSGKSHGVLAKQFDIGYSTLGKWSRDYRNSGVLPSVKQEKRPQNWSVEDRYAALLETGQLNEEDVGRWGWEHEEQLPVAGSARRLGDGGPHK